MRLNSNPSHRISESMISESYLIRVARCPGVHNRPSLCRSPCPPVRVARAAPSLAEVCGDLDGDFRTAEIGKAGFVARAASPLGVMATSRASRRCEI